MEMKLVVVKAVDWVGSLDTEMAVRMAIVMVSELVGPSAIGEVVKKVMNTSI